MTKWNDQFHTKPARRSSHDKFNSKIWNFESFDCPNNLFAHICHPSNVCHPRSLCSSSTIILFSPHYACLFARRATKNDLKFWNALITNVGMGIFLGQKIVTIRNFHFGEVMTVCFRGVRISAMSAYWSRSCMWVLTSRHRCGEAASGHILIKH